MNREIKLFDNPVSFWEQIGRPKVLSIELDGGLFRRDFEDKERFFSCLAAHNGVPDFAEDRLEAEALALRSAPNNPWSYQLEDVYEGLRADSSEEIRLLSEQFEVQDQARALIDVAREDGASIVALCEGPFSEDFWKQQLQRHEIAPFTRLYTSVDTRLTKRYWSMFRTMVADMGVAPQQIFHFGIEEYNDLNMPISLDLKGALVVPAGQTIGERVPLFGAVRKALLALPGWEGALVARTMEKVLFFHLQPSDQEQLSEKNILDICIAGPVLIGFLQWITDWLKAKKAEICLISMPECSVAARIALIVIKHLCPDVTLICVPPARAAEMGLILRDLNVSQALMVSTDGSATGAGTMVARNPLLAMQPALHLFMANAQRHTMRDVCFLHSDGLPTNRAIITSKCEPAISRLFIDDPESTQAMLPTLGRFVVTFLEMQKRYPKLRISRAAVVAILEAAQDFL